MTLSSRAVAIAAATGCPRLQGAAEHGWSDTAVAKDKGIVAIAPRLAFVEGQAFERRAIGRDHDDDGALLELLGVSGRVVRFPDGDADSELLNEFEVATADPAVVVVVQGVLPGLYGGYHRPDLLVRTEHGWVVGEVKVYLDRAGETPPHLVQSTAMQTAASIVAARQHGLQILPTALIVLASTRGAPSLRNIDVQGEIELVERLLADAPPPRGDSTTLPSLQPHRYNPSVCEGACALSDFCRAEVGAGPGIWWPGDSVAAAYGWTHGHLAEQCRQGAAPTAVQAGWDAAMASGRPPLTSPDEPSTVARTRTTRR